MRRTLNLSRQYIYWLAPYLAFVSTLSLFVFMAIMGVSLATLKNYEIQPDVTLAAYRQLLAERYVTSFLETTVLAVSIAAAALGLALLSVPTVANLSPGAQTVVSSLSIVPFFSNPVSRAFGWHTAFVGMGQFDSRIDFTYTLFAQTVASFTTVFPFCLVVMLIAYKKLDRELRVAARNLGATSLQVFIAVDFPQMRPTAAVCLLVSMLFVFGNTLDPTIVGGGKGYFWPIAILDRIKVSDWPTASAMAVLVAGPSMVVTWLASKGGQRP